MHARNDMDRRQRVAVVLLLAAVCLYISSPTVADPDLWGHVRFGQDILAGRGIPTVDPYSYLTEHQTWINHEWLSEVAFAAVFNAAGPCGLLALKSLILLGIVGLLYGRLRAQGARTLAAVAIVLLVVFIMEVGNRTIRPQLFSYFFFLLLLLVIQAADRGRVRTLWLAAPIIALWANFHGAFLAGLGLLAVWSGVRVAVIGYEYWAGRRSNFAAVAVRITQVLLPLLAALLAAMLNPYGPKLLGFLWETATVARPDIMEWQPVDITKIEGMAYLALVGISILAVATSPRRRSAAGIAALACTAILPLVALRHLPLAAMTAAVLAGEHLAAGWRRWLPKASRQWAVGSGQWQAAKNPSLTTSHRPLATSTWTLTPTFLAGALFLSGATLHNSLRIAIDPQHAAFPARAVEVLRASGVRGNLAVYFDWGEYVIWRLGPRVKVSNDGRRETIYPESLRQLNVAWATGTGCWDALLDKYPTDLALLDKRLPAYNLMRLKAGWKLAYEDALAALFVRNEPGLVRPLAAVRPADLPADGAGMCFP
jgi:hypothetical protein